MGQTSEEDGRDVTIAPGKPAAARTGWTGTGTATYCGCGAKNVVAVVVGGTTCCGWVPVSTGLLRTGATTLVLDRWNNIHCFARWVI